MSLAEDSFGRSDRNGRILMRTVMEGICVASTTKPDASGRRASDRGS